MKYNKLQMMNKKNIEVHPPQTIFQALFKYTQKTEVQIQEFEPGCRLCTRNWLSKWRHNGPKVIPMKNNCGWIFS